MYTIAIIVDVIIGCVSQYNGIILSMSVVLPFAVVIAIVAGPDNQSGYI